MIIADLTRFFLLFFTMDFVVGNLVEVVVKNLEAVADNHVVAVVDNLEHQLVENHQDNYNCLDTASFHKDCILGALVVERMLDMEHLRSPHMALAFLVHTRDTADSMERYEVALSLLLAVLAETVVHPFLLDL